jgi:hypothetical protein
VGVTDHLEYVGVTKAANTPGSAVSKIPEAQPFILKDPNNQDEIQRAFTYLVNMLSQLPVKAFMTPEVAGSIWNENVKIADQNNHPGKFTAFCSYEYTPQNNNINLHRNIFFRDCAHVPEMPYSSLDSWHPEDLWKWMDAQCFALPWQLLCEQFLESLWNPFLHAAEVQRRRFAGYLLPEMESNWQPIPPSGMFNLTVLDGTYKLPPALRVQ